MPNPANPKDKIDHSADAAGYAIWTGGRRSGKSTAVKAAVEKIRGRTADMMVVDELSNIDIEAFKTLLEDTMGVPMPKFDRDTPPGCRGQLVSALLLQDHDKRLFAWFATRVDARWTLREVCRQFALEQAYKDGLDAGWRKGRYEGNRNWFIDCPYPEGSDEAKSWNDGFGDGTEDFIAW
jgi:hypothetical protein